MALSLPKTKDDKKNIDNLINMFNVLEAKVLALETKLNGGTTNDYWVSSTSGGAVTTKLTVVTGVVK